MKKKALVSACLLGVTCRYDGGHSYTEELKKLSDEYELVPVCPEQLGGLPTPRPASELHGGDGHDVLAGNASVVVRDTREDVTGKFLCGAENTLKIARFHKVNKAFLKQYSPSCGCGSIHVGGKTIQGDGVTTALLNKHGIDVLPIE